MSVARVLAGLEAVAVRAAAAAIAGETRALAARVSGVPGVVAEAEDGVVRLRGRGLLARALGSRRRGPDAALAAAVRGDGR